MEITRPIGYLIKQYNDNAKKLDNFIAHPNKLNMETYCLNYINENEL